MLVFTSGGEIMGDESQPTSSEAKLSGSLLGLKFIWLGLVLGVVIIAVVLIVTMLTAIDGPMVDLSELGYGSLLLVPLGLFGAFVIAPMVGPHDPEKAGRKSTDEDGKNDWIGTSPDDPNYWMPLYASQFFVRGGILDGAMIIMLTLLVATGVWWILGGVAVLLAALIAQKPTVEKFNAWLEDVKARRANSGT
jgi:hypothetical protein